MKNKTYTLSTLLAAVLGLILLVCVLVRTFAPAVIMPQMNVANLVLVSLIALVLDHYMASGAKRCYICVLIYGVITFGLLPWAAAFVAPLEALKLAVKGGVTFAITTWVWILVAAAD